MVATSWLASWATDASELIRALADLTWPVMVGVVAWSLRHELPALARRLRRLRVPGAEAELDPGTSRARSKASAVVSFGCAQSVSLAPVGGPERPSLARQ